MKNMKGANYKALSCLFDICRFSIPIGLYIIHDMKILTGIIHEAQTPSGSPLKWVRQAISGADARTGGETSSLLPC
jgi:hypothetical protein